jgi:hypothetical protein
MLFFFLKEAGGVLGPYWYIIRKNTQKVQQMQNKLRDKEGSSACLDLDLKKPTDQ